MTIEEFDKLQIPENCLWELHGGELVEIAFPPVNDRRVQQRLIEILTPLFHDSQVLMECPFQVTASQDKRSADVAVVELKRSQAACKSGILTGTPEMVIEVVSPSAKELDLLRYRRLCFKNETITLWVVDADDHTVEAYSKHYVVYEPGESVPLQLLGVNTTIPVSQIFEGILL